MTDIVKLHTPSYLPTLFGSGSSGASLLSALTGHRDADAGPDDAAEPVHRADAEPRVSRDITVFTQALAEAKPPATLKVMLTAPIADDHADPIWRAGQPDQPPDLVV